MRRYLILFALLLGATGAKASDIYVTQAGGGAGTSCGSPRAVSSLSGSDWAAGNIIHLCNTISSQVSAQGNGNSGNVILVVFETGAKLSMAVCPSTGCLQLDGHSYITVDGGVPCGPLYGTGAPTSQASSCNGIIESTANGSALANHTASAIGVGMNNVAHIELKNLMIRNMYVRTSSTDLVLSSSGPPSCVYANGSLDTVKIHDSVMHDTLWCLEFVSGSVQQNLEVYNLETYNTGHSRAYGVVSQTDTNIWDHNNWDHDHSNWNSASCQYHNDGIHAYQTAGGNITNLYEYNNIFSGDWGLCPTAMTYHELIAGTLWTFNNLGLGLSTSGPIGNGCFTNTVGPSGVVKMYNNTCLLNPSNQNNYNVKWEHDSDIRNNATANSSAPLTFMPANVTVPSGRLIDYNWWQGSSSACLLFANASPVTACNGGTGYMNIAQWRSYLTTTFPTSGGESHGGASNAASNLGLNSNGVPQAGSVLINNGQNLNSICSGQPIPGLGALCADALGAVRPTTGSWTAGAINFNSAPPGSPLPPTGLTATPH
jgi:hypothetical protein